MAVIPVFNNNKDIETKDLEVHVAMCEYRRRIVEDKIASLEKNIDLLTNQSMLTKKLMLGAIVSVVTGVVTTVFSILLNYNFLKL